MAITYTKDIPDFITKVKQVTDISELETTVNQLSASMLEVQGDVTTLAGAVTALEDDIPTKTSDLTNDSGFIKAINISNGIIGSGETVASKLYDTNTPVGISVWQTQQATDAPVSGAVTTIIINKFVASGNYSLLLAQSGDHLYTSSTSTTQVTTLTWAQLV